MHEASQIFDEFWNSDAVIPLSALSKAKPEHYQQLIHNMRQQKDSRQATPYIQKLRAAPSVKTIFKEKWQIYWTKDAHIFSDPVTKVFDHEHQAWLKQKIKKVMDKTENDLQIISPYFVPGDSGCEALIAARKKQIDIRILTNSLAATDVLLVHSGYAPCRKTLLAAGVQLYELKPFGTQEHRLLGSSGASLHTKAFLIDNRIGFVGSFNFDPRSAMLNTEMGVLFDEPAIVEALQHEFDKRTSERYSYHLLLKNHKIYWQDYHADKAPVLWHFEPESHWWQRGIAKIASYLPIRSQL